MISKEWTVEIKTENGVIYICRDCERERAYKKRNRKGSNNYK